MATNQATVGSEKGNEGEEDETSIKSPDVKPKCGVSTGEGAYGAYGGSQTGCNIAGVVQGDQYYNHYEQKPQAEKIVERTRSAISNWTRGMVETSLLVMVMSRLSSGVTWVTITGSPGEGKTTAGYMALERLQKSGRQVFKLNTPEEFSEVTMTCSGPVIMLDDIFGDLEFVQDKWLRWKEVLSEVWAEKDHRSHEKMERPNEKKVTVILVGRDYVLKNVSTDIGKFRDFITRNCHVVSCSNAVERDIKEKRAILKAMCDSGGLQLDPNTVDKICRITGPHGFPHTCRLFVTLRQEDDNIDAERFFEAPLELLNKTVEKFIQDEAKLFLFKEMIRRDGEITIRELENVKRFDVEQVAKNLIGSYLKEEDGIFKFDHPSICDSVAFNLCNGFAVFVIKKCSLTFLHERLRLEPSRDTRHKTPSSESGLVVHIPRSYIKDLAKRFAHELSKGNLRQVLSHSALTDKQFIREMMLHITFHKYNFLKWRFTKHRTEFVSYIASNKSPELLKYIHEKGIQLTQSEIDTVLYGVCEYVASDVLTYLIDTRQRLDMNVRYGYMEQTPLMIAAGTRNSQIVHQIMSLNPDLNASDIFGKTVLHYLCENGLVSAVQQMIDRGIDINVKDWDGDSPLGLSCKSNQMELVRLLLDRGARIDADTEVNACLIGNMDVVMLLFENGGTFNMTSWYGTPLTAASEGGHVNVMRFLIDKGVSVNADGGSGQSPLDAACYHNKPQAVQCLVDHGADMDSRDIYNNTPLHTAAERGYRECVDVLLKAGANVDTTNILGQTPLHTAVYYNIFGLRLHDASVCQTLITHKAGINKQDTKGNTPLHLLCQVDSHHTRIYKDYLYRPASSYTDVYRTLVTLLVDHGADVNIHNNRGEPALRGWCQSLLPLNRGIRKQSRV